MKQTDTNHPRRQRSPGTASRIGRASLAILLSLLLVGSVACSSNPRPPPTAPPIEGYVVGAPDVLLVSILPEPEISREVRVRPDGMISIDLVGDVQAAGRTPFEIAQTIQQEISRYKRDAAVNVTVTDSPSQFVTVYGEVAQPGTFPLTSETRASEAIGYVGGTRPFASLNSIRVIRTNGATTSVLMVRLADISNGDLTTNIVIEKGDLIVVPPTILARIGYAMQMLLFPIQPLIGTAVSAGSIAAGAGTIHRATN